MRTRTGFSDAGLSEQGSESGFSREQKMWTGFPRQSFGEPKIAKKISNENKLKGMSRMFTNLRKSCCESDRLLTKNNNKPTLAEFKRAGLENFDITSIVRNAVRESITQLQPETFQDPSLEDALVQRAIDKSLNQLAIANFASEKFPEPNFDTNFSSVHPKNRNHYLDSNYSSVLNTKSLLDRSIKITPQAINYESHRHS